MGECELLYIGELSREMSFCMGLHSMVIHGVNVLVSESEEQKKEGKYSTKDRAQ